MIPGTFNFKPQYKGNTFNGVQLTFEKEVDGVYEPIDLTGAALLMQLKINANSISYKDFANGSGLTIVDAVNGIVNIDKFMVNLNPAKYVYDLKVTFQDGTVSTYLTGYFDVKQNLV